MNEQNYKYNISENCFGRRYDHESIKEGLGIILGNSNGAFK